MIYHLADQGVVRTDPADPNVFRCSTCSTTWTDKALMWVDCTPEPETPTAEPLPA